MAILTSALFPQSGPYLHFAVLPDCIELDHVGWPTRDQYKEHVFYELASDLIDATCAILHSWFPFDTTEFYQFSRPSQIYDFSSTILELAARVAACPEHHFQEGVWIYESSLVDAQHRTAQHLKVDLLETLLFIADTANRAAKEGKCFVIVGF